MAMGRNDLDEILCSVDPLILWDTNAHALSKSRIYTDVSSHPGFCVGPREVVGCQSVSDRLRSLSDSRQVPSDSSQDHIEVLAEAFAGVKIQGACSLVQERHRGLAAVENMACETGGWQDYDTLPFRPCGPWDACWRSVQTLSDWGVWAESQTPRRQTSRPSQTEPKKWTDNRLPSNCRPPPCANDIRNHPVFLRPRALM